MSLTVRQLSVSQLSMCSGAAMRRKLDGAIGNGEPQGRADRALDEADIAAMRAHQFGGDGEAEAGAAGAGRALERLEQMLARLRRKARPGIGHFDHDDRAFAAAGDADLVAAGI